MASDVIIYAISFGFVGLLVYCMLRFGPVEHGWAKFTKEEVETIRRLNRERSAFLGNTQPEGPALYKKSMISHNGLAVYQNGVYAKFCVATKGKYRFVPFSRISGIYPVEMINPFTRGDSLLTGLSSWKALQVETEDYTVYIVDSRAHDFQTLIPLLKNAMGTQWNAVYRENMPIRGKMLEAPFLRHTYLRGVAVPQPVPAPTGPSAPITFQDAPVMQPQAQVEGYGALLAQESPEDMRERAKAFRKGGALLLLIGCITLVIGIVLMTIQDSVSLAIVPVIFGVLIIILGAAIFRARNSTVPIKLYENGLTQPNLMGNDIFIPYGKINNVTETNNFIDGALIMLKTSDGQIAGLRKSSRSLMETFEKIMPKINDSRYDFTVKHEIPKAMGGKAELFAYIFAPLLGLALAFFLAFEAYGTLTMFHYIFTIVYIWPSMAILIMIFIVRVIRKIPKIVGHKPGWKAPMAIVAAMLILFFAGQGVIYNIEFPSTSSGGVACMEITPTYSVLNGTFYENQVLNLTGPVFVSDTTSLQICNSTLRFGGNADKVSSVYVADGGTLILDNCTLLSSSAGITYSFEAYGNLEMTDCDVTGVWGDAEHENYDGGLEIYSDNATLTRVTVRDAVTNGMFAMNATVTVEGCVFENCGDDGLEIKAATVIIANTTISNAGWAMVIDDESDVTVTHSIIEDNDYGICAEDAVVNINNSTFRNNGNYAIEYRTVSATNIENNTFIGNEMDVSGPGGYTLILVCNMMVVIEAVICAMFIIYSHKTTAN